LHVLKELAQYITAVTTDELADRFSKTLARSKLSPSYTVSRQVSLAGEVEISVNSSQIDVSLRGTGTHVSILVMHEPDWLYPDDERLWRFSSHATIPTPVP
jgi:hypothetical protein